MPPNFAPSLTGLRDLAPGRVRRELKCPVYAFEREPLVHQCAAYNLEITDLGARRAPQGAVAFPPHA